MGFIRRRFRCWLEGRKATVEALIMRVMEEFEGSVDEEDIEDALRSPWPEDFKKKPFFVTFLEVAFALDRLVKKGRLTCEHTSTYSPGVSDITRTYTRTGY